MPELIGAVLIIVLLVVVLLAAAIRWICEKIYDLYRIVSGKARREEEWQIEELRQLEEQKAGEEKQQARIDRRMNKLREQARREEEERTSCIREIKEDCALLGVDEYYTVEELNAARRTKAAQWHPDKLDNMAPELKEFASLQLARFNAAYDRLEKRVKWNTEPKTLEAECQDTAVMMETLNSDLACVESADNSVELSRLGKMIERLDDGIRRMRACLTRLQKEAPTMDVTTLKETISKYIACSRSVKSSMARIADRQNGIEPQAPQVEEIEREGSLEDEVEKAGMAWRTKAAEILSRNTDASILEMPFETLKAFQKYIHLRAESLRRLAVGTLQDKSLEEAMLEVQQVASTCTPECLAKAMELLRNSSTAFRAQRQI
jgi:hypothetical protein